MASYINAEAIVCTERNDRGEILGFKSLAAFERHAEALKKRSEWKEYWLEQRDRYGEYKWELIEDDFPFSFTIREIPSGFTKTYDLVFTTIYK